MEKYINIKYQIGEHTKFQEISTGVKQSPWKLLNWKNERFKWIWDCEQLQVKKSMDIFNLKYRTIILQQCRIAVNLSND